MNMTVLANEIDLSPLPAAMGADKPLWDSPLPFLGAVKVRVCARIGGAEISVGDLLELKQGAVLALDQSLDEPIDILVDGHVVARGSLVAIDDQFGIRLTETPLSLGSNR